MRNQTFIAQALMEAKIAFDQGEVPVGAIIVHKGEIIARGHNEIESRGDATAHAEILTISRASAIIGDWRLNECELYVTLEPCPMCTGAIKLSRVGTVVFGAKDPRFGAAGSTIDIMNEPKLGYVPKLTQGIMENECADILKQFFKSIRIAK